jgi:hypothetical protein
MVIEREHQSGDALYRVMDARERTIAALAREYPHLSPDEIRSFFAKAKWCNDGFHR